MTVTTETGFIDIHHHIIYGVDDGPQTLDESRQMLALAYADGTRHIIATPHFNPVGKCPDVTLLKERLAELNVICTADFPGLTVHLGAEVLFGEGVRRKLCEGIIPTLAGSNYVLVEFVPSFSRNNIEKAVRHLANGGYVTVLAHSERYPAITRSLQFTNYLRKKYGALIQVNADTFLFKQSFHLRWFLRKAMKLGMIDIVASDAHNTHKRQTRLKDAYAVIADKYGHQLGQNLFTKHVGMFIIESLSI